MCLCPLVNIFLVLGEKKMVQRLKQIVAEYEDRLRKMPWVAWFSYGRGLLRKDGP